MGLWALLNHTLNFLAPALWLALLLPWASRWLTASGVTRSNWRTHALVLSLVGSAVLLVGLVLFDRDGKMLTYLALVVVLASVQAWLLRKSHPLGR